MKEIGYICCFGEVLWDMLPTGKLPGGAPMNVAIHLHNLGIESFVISKVGDDSLGQEIKAFINSKKCPVGFLQTDENHGTGIVSVSLNAKKEASYDIVRPIAWDFIEANAANIALINGAEAIVFGTLSCRNEISKKTLLTFLKATILKIYDVNFRQPFFDQNLVEELLQQADIVKMNEDEIEVIASWQGNDFVDNQAIMTFLAHKFNLEAIILTRGENGAAVLTQEGFFETAGFEVTVADTIGSGDAFLAGFLKNYLAKKPTAEALQYAAAIGALVASFHGANPPINEADVFTMIASKQSAQ